MTIGSTLGKWSGFSALRVERILIVGVTPLVQHLVQELEVRRCEVVGIVDDRELTDAADVKQLEATIDHLAPHRIIMALSERRGRTPVRVLLDSRLRRGVVVEDVAKCYERLTGKLALESLTPMGVALSGRFRPPRFQQVLARLASLAFALMALIVLSPIFVIVAAAIKLDSPGPVFFRQRRVGKHGKPFTLVKFRTMHDREKRSEWEGDNIDAVTRVGRWLRSFRIDEIPQFINILRGEMNVVGPRPHPVTNHELFTLVARNLTELTGAALSCYELRALVRPGLTGWAQVRYRYANNLEEELEKLKYDLYYVKYVSPWLDLRILLETFRVLRGQTALEVTMSKSRRVRNLKLKPVRRSSMPFLWLLLVLGMSATVAAQQKPSSGTPQPRPAAVTQPAQALPKATGVENGYEYIIGPDDELDVAVWNNEALTRSVLVRPDGRISLPLVNDMQAAGQTPMQLQGALTKALSGYIQDPSVSVIVKAVHSYKVSVMGEVKEPGRFELTGRATVLDVLAMAKGFNEFADKGRIVILRTEKGVTRQIPFAYAKLLSENGENLGRDNFFVQPGDVVLVR